MRNLILVGLIIAFIQANPSNQAFQQGRSAINNFNKQVDQASTGLQRLLNNVALSRENALALIAYANKLNPKTVEECEKVLFATEFCFEILLRSLRNTQSVKNVRCLLRM